jgi:hypothetical protein
VFSTSRVDWGEQDCLLLREDRSYQVGRSAPSRRPIREKLPGQYVNTSQHQGNRPVLMYLSAGSIEKQDYHSENINDKIRY